MWKKIALCIALIGGLTFFANVDQAQANRYRGNVRWNNGNYHYRGGYGGYYGNRYNYGYNYGYRPYYRSYGYGYYPGYYRRNGYYISTPGFSFGF